MHGGTSPHRSRREEGGPTGSTHGTGYTYDTHVPFLMMGAGVSAGSSHEIMHITDVVDKVAEKANLPYAPNSLIH